MEGVMAAGIRRGRCEFPNCMCPCMELHGDGGMCSRCHHVDAWHANLDRSSTTDYAEALGLTSLAAPRGRVPSPPAEDPEQHPAAQATHVCPPCRGTARVPASTDTLVANILSQEMKTDSSVSIALVPKALSYVGLSRSTTLFRASNTGSCTLGSRRGSYLPVPFL